MKLFRFSIIVLLALSSCLQEQLNPLRDDVIANCFDGKLNQDEEGIDCGGICPLCPPPVIAPCTDDLEDNIVSSELVGLGRLEFFSIDCGVSSSIGDYEIRGSGSFINITIRLSDNIVEPMEKIFDLQGSISSSDEGKATMRVISSFSGDFQSGSGELYVTFDGDKAIVEFCDVALRPRSSSTSFKFSGRIVCE